METENHHCPYHELILEKYIFNDISSEDESRLEKHISSCTRCQKDIEIIEKNNHILSTWPSLTLSVSFKEKLLKRIDSVDRKKRIKSRIIKIAAVAAMIPLFFSAYTIITKGYVKYNSLYGYFLDDGTKVNPGKLKLERDDSLEKRINSTIKESFSNRGDSDQMIAARVYVKERPGRYYGKMEAKKSFPHSKTKGYAIAPGEAVVFVRLKERKGGVPLNLNSLKRSIRSRYNYYADIKVIRKEIKRNSLEHVELVVSRYWQYLIYFILIEFSVRFLLIIHVKKSNIKKKKLFYVFSIVFGSIFFPVYLILSVFLRKKMNIK